MDITPIWNRTLKYRQTKEHTKDMVHLTLIRIAENNAEALIRECDNIDEVYGIVVAYNHAVTTVALYCQITNGENSTLQEVYGLQVAILAELLMSEDGKLLRKLRG